MQKSFIETAFSLTDLLPDFTSLCCFHSYAKQPCISGRLTKIWQDGNSVSIRFMVCRAQNSILWALLVSLLCLLLSFNTCTLAREPKIVSSHFACSAAKGFASVRHLLSCLKHNVDSTPQNLSLNSSISNSIDNSRVISSSTVTVEITCAS